MQAGPDRRRRRATSRRGRRGRGGRCSGGRAPREPQSHRDERVGLVEVDERELVLLGDEARDLGTRDHAALDERLAEPLARDPAVAVVALVGEGVFELFRLTRPSRISSTPSAGQGAVPELPSPTYRRKPPRPENRRESEDARGRATGSRGVGPRRRGGRRLHAVPGSSFSSASQRATARRTRCASRGRSRACASSRTRRGVRPVAPRRRRRGARREPVHADRRHAKGNRPSFTGAPPEVAEPLYERFCDALEQEGVPVARGRLRRADGGLARQRRPGHDRARHLENGARALALALGAAILHAGWNVLLARSRDVRAATRSRSSSVVVSFAPFAATLAGGGGSDSLDRGLGSAGARRTSSSSPPPTAAPT